jgi:hypothetical protein
MDSRTTVLARFPHARAAYHKANADALLPHDRYSHWSVFEGPGVNSRMIGVSMSEEGAWQDAAATVRGEAEGSGRSADGERD